MKFTNHFLKRISQRGIAIESILKVFDLGSSYHCGSGCFAFIVPRKKCTRSEFRKLQSVVFIMNGSGVCITAYHLAGKLPAHWTIAKVA